MQKGLISTLMLCLSASSLFAIKVTLFEDTDSYIARAQDIIIAECISIEAEKVDVDTDGLQAAKVKVVKVLKGNRKPGELRIASLYPIQKGRIYMLSSLGGSRMGSDFLAVPELSVVPLPSNFRFSDLDSKVLKEQVQIVFSRYLFEVDKEYRRILTEKRLLEKAVDDRTSVWFKSKGPITLGEIRQASTEGGRNQAVWLDLNGNKLQWSQGNPGKTGYFYFEKMERSRWSPFWAFAHCDVPITKLKGTMLKAKFYGLFDPHGDETRINWAGEQSIQVEVGQTILARTLEDTQTIYAIQIVSQGIEREQMDFRYAVIHP